MQNVTSPVTPTASAPSLTAFCSWGVRSGVPARWSRPTSTPAFWKAGLPRKSTPLGRGRDVDDHHRELLVAVRLRSRANAPTVPGNPPVRVNTPGRGELLDGWRTREGDHRDSRTGEERDDRTLARVGPESGDDLLLDELVGQLHRPGGLVGRRRGARWVPGDTADVVVHIRDGDPCPAGQRRLASANRAAVGDQPDGDRRACGRVRRTERVEVLGGRRGGGRRGGGRRAAAPDELAQPAGMEHADRERGEDPRGMAMFVRRRLMKISSSLLCAGERRLRYEPR